MIRRPFLTLPKKGLRLLYFFALDSHNPFIHKPPAAPHNPFPSTVSHPSITKSVFNHLPTPISTLFRPPASPQPQPPSSTPIPIPNNTGKKLITKCSQQIKLRIIDCFKFALKPEQPRVSSSICLEIVCI